jgi:hypothetical protein
MEQLDLTTPVVVPDKTYYRVIKLHLEWDLASIEIVVVGSDAVVQAFGYNGAQAISLMTILNTANLSVKSLQKRVLEKLVADGLLGAGTVTGTPS